MINIIIKGIIAGLIWRLGRIFLIIPSLRLENLPLSIIYVLIISFVYYKLIKQNTRKQAILIFIISVLVSFLFLKIFDLLSISKIIAEYGYQNYYDESTNSYTFMYVANATMLSYHLMYYISTFAAALTGILISQNNKMKANPNIGMVDNTNKSVYKINAMFCIFKGFLINAFFIVDHILAEHFDYPYVYEIYFIICCILYTWIYYCKTEREHFIVFISSTVFHVIIFVISLFLFEYNIRFAMNVVGFTIIHVIIALIAVIISMIMSSHYQKKNFIMEYVDDEWVYYIK